MSDERILKVSGRDRRTIRIPAELWPFTRESYVRHVKKLLANGGELHTVGDGGSGRPKGTCRLCEEIVRLPVVDMVAIVRDAGS